MVVLAIFGAWFVLSIPLGMLVGKAAARNSTVLDAPRPRPAAEPVPTYRKSLANF